jgi:hypothetical protein
VDFLGTGVVVQFHHFWITVYADVRFVCCHLNLDIWDFPGSLYIFQYLFVGTSVRHALYNI